MVKSNNAAYFSLRAEQEDEAARAAVNLRAATIHRSLAARYKAAACHSDDRQKLSLVLD